MLRLCHPTRPCLTEPALSAPPPHTCCCPAACLPPLRAQFSEEFHDAAGFGWSRAPSSHNWSELIKHKARTGLGWSQIRSDLISSVWVFWVGLVVGLGVGRTGGSGGAEGGATWLGRQQTGQIKVGPNSPTSIHRVAWFIDARGARRPDGRQEAAPTLTARPDSPP